MEAIAEPEVEQVEEDPKAVLDAAEKQHYDEIKRINVLVDEAVYEHDIAKNKAKAAKEHLEGLQSRLSRLISEGPQVPDPQKELPFEDAEKLAWRDVDISQFLTLTEKQSEKLAEAGIVNVGQFEDLRGGAGLNSLKGVGEKTIDKWENQIVEWLAANSREQEPTSDEPAGN